MMVTTWTTIKAFPEQLPDAPEQFQDRQISSKITFANLVTIPKTVLTPAELPTEHYSLHSPEHYAELLFGKARGQNTVHK